MSYFKEIGLTKIHLEYFSCFPVLEGVILQRYKNIVNFCKEYHLSQESITNYFKGRCKPSYEFIKICLKEFDDYSFEDLFWEREVEE